MTFVWFIIWFLANLIGANEPITLDPVNGWAGTLLFAIAIDIGVEHV
jgi:hypothetical protein